jgi:hypothetical protein
MLNFGGKILFKSLGAVANSKPKAHETAQKMKTIFFYITVNQNKLYFPFPGSDHQEIKAVVP